MTAYDKYNLETAIEICNLFVDYIVIDSNDINDSYKDYCEIVSLLPYRHTKIIGLLHGATQLKFVQKATAYLNMNILLWDNFDISINDKFMHFKDMNHWLKDEDLTHQHSKLDINWNGVGFSHSDKELNSKKYDKIKSLHGDDVKVLLFNNFNTLVEIKPFLDQKDVVCNIDTRGMNIDDIIDNLVYLKDCKCQKSLFIA